MLLSRLKTPEGKVRAYRCYPSISTSPKLFEGKGFNGDERASLLMAFRGLQAESVAQGNAHRAIAKELTDLVAGPFDDWAA